MSDLSLNYIVDGGTKKVITGLSLLARHNPIVPPPPARIDKIFRGPLETPDINAFRYYARGTPAGFTRTAAFTGKTKLWNKIDPAGTVALMQYPVIDGDNNIYLTSGHVSFKSQFRLVGLATTGSVTFDYYGSDIEAAFTPLLRYSGYNMEFRLFTANSPNVALTSFAAGRNGVTFVVVAIYGSKVGGVSYPLVIPDSEEHFLVNVDSSGAITLSRFSYFIEKQAGPGLPYTTEHTVPFVQQDLGGQIFATRTRAILLAFWKTTVLGSSTYAYRFYTYAGAFVTQPTHAPGVVGTHFPIPHANGYVALEITGPPPDETEEHVLYDENGVEVTPAWLATKTTNVDPVKAVTLITVNNEWFIDDYRVPNFVYSDSGVTDSAGTEIYEANTRMHTFGMLTAYSSLRFETGKVAFVDLSKAIEYLWVTHSGFSSYGFYSRPAVFSGLASI